MIALHRFRQSQVAWLRHAFEFLFGRNACKQKLSAGFLFNPAFKERAVAFERFVDVHLAREFPRR
ncbi:MAG: hypothetical protein K2H67_05605, partial [Treponemataceae bacterium]|nr:hypothetical protein [Treponemataceae bacterium]